MNDVSEPTANLPFAAVAVRVGLVVAGAFWFMSHLAFLAGMPRSDVGALAMHLLAGVLGGALLGLGFEPTTRSQRNAGALLLLVAFGQLFVLPTEPAFGWVVARARSPFLTGLAVVVLMGGGIELGVVAVRPLRTRGTVGRISGLLACGMGCVWLLSQALRVTH